MGFVQSLGVVMMFLSVHLNLQDDGESDTIILATTSCYWLGVILLIVGSF